MSPRRHRPVLVTGAHRSGTTWVGHTLCLAGRHVLVNEPFKLKYRPGICDHRFERWFTHLEGASAAVAAPALRRTVALRYRLPAQLAACRSPAQLGYALKSAVKWRIARARGRVALLKDPIAFFSAEWLADTFGLEVVVCVRHPAAFAASLKRYGHRFPFADLRDQPALMSGHLAPFADQIESYARDEREIVDQAALLWRAIYETAARRREHRPDWIHVRHEDLSLEPVERFRELYARLGLDLADATARSIEAMTGGANPARIPEGASHHWIRLDSRANLRQWETRLTSDEVARLRAATWPTFRKFYDASEW